MSDEERDHPVLHPGVGVTERMIQLPDGRRLRSVIAGDQEGPLVVFESGMGSPAAAWLPVQRSVSSFSRTLSYDRAGYGASDVDSHGRTIQRMADDLELMLDASGATGPLVFVAHSWGGPIVRHFAHDHPDRVHGIVFVEGTVAEVLSERGSRLEALMFGAMRVLMSVGATSLVKRLVLPRGASSDISREDMDILWRDFASRRAVRARMQEAKEVSATLGALRRLQALGTPDVPTVALQGGRVSGRRAIDALRQTFTASVQSLMEAQPRGRVVIVEDAGHMIPLERPDAVSAAIRDVLAGIGNGRGQHT